MIFVIIATCQWVLLSGLRHISIGADTVSYFYNYTSTMKMSWENIIEEFQNVYFHQQEGKDPGYLIFEKLTQAFTTDYQIYLIIIAILFTVPLGMFIYRNSKEPLFSFLIYSCLFYSFYAITGHRQTIATAMVVLIGYELIKTRKLVPFILITLVAFTIHKSAILFFPFYFIANKKLTKTYIITMVIMGAFILFLGELFYAPLVYFIGYDNYLNNEFSGTGTFTLMMVMVGLMAFWRMKKILQNNPQSIHFMNALILALLFSLLTLENQSFMRAQQYFSLFIMLLIPEIIYSFEKRERILVYYVSAAVLLILFARNNPQYLFFWQG
jgi:transmembrane protein EpsG